MCPEGAGTTNQGSTDRGTGLIGVAAGLPTFRSLSFEDSVRLFKQWGFQVEPGPRPEQITVILEGSDFRAVSVYDAQILPEIAATVGAPGFIYRDDAHVDRVLQGEIGAEVSRIARAKTGVEFVDYGEVGFRHILAKGR